MKSLRDYIFEAQKANVPQYVLDRKVVSDWEEVDMDDVQKSLTPEEKKQKFVDLTYSEGVKAPFGVKGDEVAMLIWLNGNEEYEDMIADDEEEEVNWEDEFPRIVKKIKKQNGVVRVESRFVDKEINDTDFCNYLEHTWQPFSTYNEDNLVLIVIKRSECEKVFDSFARLNSLAGPFICSLNDDTHCLVNLDSFLGYDDEEQEEQMIKIMMKK